MGEEGTLNRQCQHPRPIRKSRQATQPQQPNSPPWTVKAADRTSTACPLFFLLVAKAIEVDYPRLKERLRIEIIL